MKVVVGLGNPGKKYERSRHNLGFSVMDRLADKNRVAVTRKKYESLIGEWNRDGEKVLLVKPQTFMNRSGQALRSLLRYLPVEAEDLIVIHDDLDLPFGRIRIRQQGSAGGNRGMLSVLEALGDRPFIRLRIGIGRPPPAVDPADFVLQSFSPDETGRLDDVTARAVEAVQCLLDEGARRAMEKFNRAE
ncbi:MAG: aminoacyl-tRNA hydrolase [Candidatus Binatia bacterium]